MNKLKKISPLQVVRLIIQLAFFILLPGLYINAFSGIKQIYLSIINQNFNISNYLPQLVEVIAIVPVTIILGRFFCGWMCAFGTLGDILHHISNKVFKVNFKVNEKLDSVLKYLKFVILGFLIVAVWTFGFKVFSGANPWDAFGALWSFGKLPDFTFAFSEFTIGTLILFAIIVASFFIERFFCRYLCPLGAVFTIISMLRIVKIKKPAKDCGSCKICTKSCAMGIPLYKHNKINSGECIHCFKCISPCPRKNVTVSIGKEEIKNSVAAAVAVSCISGIYCTGNLISKSVSIDTSSNISTSSNPSKSAKSLKYANGTYEGSGTGFRGATTTVSVTVENDIIKDIEVLSYGDDRPYFENSYSFVEDQILSSQSTDVDALSGATYSSVGIMEAVSNALESAKLSQTSDSSQSTLEEDAEIPTESSEETPTTSNEASPTDAIVNTVKPTPNINNKAPDRIERHDKRRTPKDAPDKAFERNIESTATIAKAVSTPKAQSASIYKDGTYEGSARGFRRGITEVSVTVKKDKITDIQVLSHGDDIPYFEAASDVITNMLETQSTDVDVVSGATYSSMGIMNAVEAALESARI